MTTVPTHSIRRATSADVSSLLDLYAETGLDDGHQIAHKTAISIFQKLELNPDYRTFVASGRGGAVCGTYAILMMEGMAHSGAPLAIVEHVAVAATEQGKGIGALMMRHAMDAAAARGCYKLALSSNVRREKAHAFYDKLGFTRHGYSFVVDLIPGRQPEVFAD